MQNVGPSFTEVHPNFVLAAPNCPILQVGDALYPSNADRLYAWSGRRFVRL